MRILYISIFALFLFACTSDNEITEIQEEEVVEEIDKDTVSQEPVDSFAGEIIIHNREKTQEGLVLVNDASANRVYLMEKENSKILKEWELPSGIGNDAVLLDDGSLFVALTDPSPSFQFGGFGGRMAIISPEGELKWDYEYSNEENLSHHDIEMLPNGNILFIAWEKKSAEEIAVKGYKGEYEEIYTEKLLEIDPSMNQVVWEWHAWDHLIQDSDPEAENYGVIADNPGRININYEDPFKDGIYNGDIFHANALDYDPENDLIYLSVNFFSEVWVIDHSTSMSEARSGSGGNFDKGGDLVYRFGNPGAYNNSKGERMFYHNHHPNLVPDSNTILVYSNGISEVDPHSVVYELELPEEFQLKAGHNNELTEHWSFSDPDLFADKVSGARRLDNGNTLITEGDFGFWEVTGSGEVVWKFEGDGFFWRGYHYNEDSEAILNLELENLR